MYCTKKCLDILIEINNKKKPYEVLFGCKVKVELSISNLPKEDIDN